MGWDLNIRITVPETKDKWAILPDIVEAMIESELFEFEQMRVISNELMVEKKKPFWGEGEVAKFTSNQGVPLDTLKTWLDKQIHTGNLLEISFSANRFRSKEEYAIRYPMRLLVYDNFPAYRKPYDSDFIYDSGSKNLYNWRGDKETTHENLLNLIDELALFAKSGVKSLFGLGIDMEENPKTHHVCFHRDIKDFLNHILTTDIAGKTKTNLTYSDLDDIRSQIPEIEGKRLGEGYIIWSTLGTNKTLSNFYSMLANKYS